MHSFRIGAEPIARVERIYRGHVGATENEVEDVEVLNDALGPERFRNGRPPMLHMPSEHHLCGRLVMFGRDLNDTWMREGVARGARAPHAVAER